MTASRKSGFQSTSPSASASASSADMFSGEGQSTLMQTRASHMSSPAGPGSGMHSNSSSSGPGSASLSASPSRYATGVTRGDSSASSVPAGALPMASPTSSSRGGILRTGASFRSTSTNAVGAGAGAGALASPMAGSVLRSVSGIASAESDAPVPVSTAELFEAENFKAVGKEWETLQTLKLVFERSELDAEQQRRFLKALTEANFHGGEYIVRQGADASDGFYIITEGEVIVTRNITAEEAAVTPASLVMDAAAGVGSPGGKERVITHLYEGHSFGETALVNDALRNANVRVISGDVSCMVISRAAFKPFLDQDPKFRAMVSALVAKKAETAMRREEMLKEQGGTVITPEEQRNEVKISKLFKKGKTSNGKTVINGYVLLSKLGQGSFGTVYLAMSLAHSKKYAMKVISRSLLKKRRVGSNKSDDQLLREVAVMKQLAHPNVVALYEVIDDPASGRFYLVQEWLELGPVMAELEFNQALEPRLARKYFRGAFASVQLQHDTDTADAFCCRRSTRSLHDLAIHSFLRLSAHNNSPLQTCWLASSTCTSSGSPTAISSPPTC